MKRIFILFFLLLIYNLYGIEVGEQLVKKGDFLPQSRGILVFVEIPSLSSEALLFYLSYKSKEFFKNNISLTIIAKGEEREVIETLKIIG
jgi:hypothetical protein